MTRRKKTTAADVRARVQSLTEKMLAVLEKKVIEASKQDQAWEMLFSAKDNAVGHLQKLVKLMSDTAEHAPITAAPEALSKEEIALLQAWLRDP